MLFFHNRYIPGAFGKSFQHRVSCTLQEEQ